MNIIFYNTIDNKIIELRDSFVIIDRDIAELYGVETKRVNEAVSNNPDKFPSDYMFELSKDEKTKVVEHFDHLAPIKYSPYLPKAFTKKGLWMLATILSSKQAKETTFLIIKTFDKIDNLKYNLKITLVLLFYIWLGYFSFGYVGVDIFFVLSGYLITQIICTKLETNTFSFKEFYRLSINND